MLSRPICFSYCFTLLMKFIRSNLCNLLFRGPNEFTGEIEMMCATALLIYLLENNSTNLPEQIYILILAIVKFNILKVKSKSLKVLNSQLQGLLLWINPGLVLKFIEKENIAEVFMKELLVYEGKYE